MESATDRDRPPSEQRNPAALADKILERSLKYGDFVLSSGRRSKYYVDKYEFLCEPALLREVAEALLAKVPQGTDRIAGVEGGAGLLVTGMSLLSGIPSLIVRKGRKGYGTDKWLEGSWLPGMQVTLVEDVVTTGAQMAAAAQALTLGGLKVVKLLCVVNRGAEEGFPAEVDCLVRLSSDDQAVATARQSATS